MSRRKAGKSWIVRMRVERDIDVEVLAVDEAEARAKAEAWDIVGREMEGDTLNCKITSVEPNE